MVKKLYKYEFKSYGAWVLLMYAAMIVAAVLLMAALHLTDDLVLFRDNEDLSKIIIYSIRTLFFIIYAISIIASFTLIVILPIVRFYKNMLTSEGYLTLSLPVTPSQHIICKSAVAYIYQIGAVIALLASLLVIVLLSGDAADIFEIIGKAIAGIWDAFFSPDFKVRWQIMLIVTSAVISPIAGMLMYYFCLSAGMLFGKYKLFGSVITYIIIQTVGTVFTSICQIVFMPLATLFTDIVAVVSFIAVFVFFFSICQILLFYFGTHYMFKHRVNL